jgi:hypothetical protein
MNGFEIALVGGVLVSAAFTARAPQRSLFYAGQTFANRYRLWIDDECAAAVMRAERRVRRAHALVLVIVALGLAVLFLAGVHTVLVLPAAGALMVAARLAVRVLWAGREFPLAPGRPSLARARAVQVSDFVHPKAWVALGVWLVAALGTTGVGLARGSVALAAGGGAVGVLTVTTGVAVLAWCRRPEPAGDSAHLFLQDAWRASRIRETFADLALAATVLASSLASALEPDAVGWPAVVLVLLVPMGLASSIGANRFRERLWPDLPAGQVVAVASAR